MYMYVYMICIKIGRSYVNVFGQMERSAWGFIGKINGLVKFKECRRLELTNGVRLLKKY